MALARRLTEVVGGTRERRDRREPPPGTFLLGAGAHLGGLPALHAYLSASPQCAAGPHREYHVLDSAGLASERWVRELLLDRAQANLDATRVSAPVNGRALHRAAMIADPEVYLDHFTALLARPGVRLALDLTPDHSLLDADQLAVVRDGFTERGVRTAAAFVMRDPLDRVVTHIRLQRRRRPADFEGSLEECVERHHTDPAYERRTRYERTIAALDEVFEPGSAWFGFHERLTSVESLTAVSNVCRIDYREPDPGLTRPRPTATAGLQADLAREVVGHYRDTYEYVADRFGLDDLVSWWPSARYAF